MTDFYNNIIELVSKNEYLKCENFVINNVNDLNLIIDFFDSNIEFLNDNTKIIITKIFIKLIYFYPNKFSNYNKSYLFFKKILNHNCLNPILKNYIINFEKNKIIHKNIIDNILVLKKNINKPKFIEKFDINDNLCIFTITNNFNNILNKNIWPFINSIVDKNISNSSFFSRIKSANTYTTKKINSKEIERRLVYLYKFFGKDFFKLYKIKCISNQIYFKFNYDEKVNYFFTVYNSISTIFRNFKIKICDFNLTHTIILNNLNYELSCIKFNSESEDILNEDILFSFSDDDNSCIFDENEIIEDVLNNIIEKIIDIDIKEKCSKTIDSIINNLK